MKIALTKLSGIWYNIGKGKSMGIPNSRIDQSRQLDKALVRKRRQYTRQKDWQRKHLSGRYNYFAHPKSYIRKQWFKHWDYADWELEKKHTRQERILAKHKGRIYDGDDYLHNYNSSNRNHGISDRRSTGFSEGDGKS